MCASKRCTAVIVVIEGGLHEREVLGGEVPMRISTN
jgi:hypothetical protein